MEYCATLIGRRSGAPAKRILKRWRGEILAVRRARMARRILPKPTDKECFLDGTAEEIAVVKGFNAYVEEKELPWRIHQRSLENRHRKSKQKTMAQRG